MRHFAAIWLNMTWQERMKTCCLKKKKKLKKEESSDLPILSKICWLITHSFPTALFKSAKCHTGRILEESCPKPASLSIVMSQYLITRRLLFAFSLSPAAQLGLNGFVTSAKHFMAWLSVPEHVQPTDLAEDVKSSFNLMGECFHCLIGSVAQVQIIVGGLQLQKPHLGKLWGSCGRMLHCTPIRKGNVKHMRCEKWAITRLRSRRKIVP